MMKCLVVDDEPYARKLLEEFIQKTPELVYAGSATHALEARAFLSQQKVDVIFLDIQMPEFTGIDFLKTISQRPSVVFTTAFAAYALEGFELDVVDYLLKPFDFQRFLKAVNKITERSLVKTQSLMPPPERLTNYIFVKDAHRLVKIDFHSILYIKGTREYVTFVTTGGKTMSLMSMKSLEQLLPAEFIRIHNSYIVRLGAIQSVSKNDVSIAGQLLPLGITYKKVFLERLPVELYGLGSTHK
jgi:DNA-binding LytR/AlgR family response regulator